MPTKAKVSSFSDKICDIYVCILKEGKCLWCSEGICAWAQEYKWSCCSHVRSAASELHLLGDTDPRKRHPPASYQETNVHLVS